MVATIVIYQDIPKLPIEDMTWRRYVAVVLIIPGVVYFIFRIDEMYSEIDSPLITWQKFRLFCLLVGSFGLNLYAAIFLGYRK